MPTTLAGKIRAIKRKRRARMLGLALIFGLLCAALTALLILGMSWVGR